LNFSVPENVRMKNAGLKTYYNSFVCGNLRGVSTNKTIIYFIAMQTYKELKNVLSGIGWSTFP
jgi:hypothetical protein